MINRNIDRQSNSGTAISPAVGGSETLRSEAIRFLDYLATYRRCSPATCAAYRGDIAAFIEFHCAASPGGLAEISQAALMRYLATLSHLAPNTIRRRIHALGSWMDFLVRQGLITANPTRDLPLPRRERRLTRVPTPEQCERMLSAARSPVEVVTIWLLVTTGLRRAELIGLDTADVVSDGTEIRVMGKGRRERLLPLPAKCQEVLSDYLIQRGERDGPLLLNRAGKRLGLTSLRRLFERLQHRAGVEGFTIHSMRHSYATMLVKAGVDLGTVRDLLGHSDLSVTSIYLHSDLRSKRLAVEQLPVLMIGGGEGE